MTNQVHLLDIHERAENGRAFATCSCGWKSPVRCNDRKLVLEQARRHTHYIYEKSIRDAAEERAAAVPTFADDRKESRPSRSSGDPTEAAV